MKYTKYQQNNCVYTRRWRFIGSDRIIRRVSRTNWASRYRNDFLHPTFADVIYWHVVGEVCRGFHYGWFERQIFHTVEREYQRRKIIGQEGSWFTEVEFAACQISSDILLRNRLSLTWKRSRTGSRRNPCRCQNEVWQSTALMHILRCCKI